MPDRRLQAPYEEARYDRTVRSLDDRIATAMFRYLTEDLGLSIPVAQDRTELELTRAIAKSVCDDLTRLGLGLSGKRVLDLGAGLGGMATEIASRGGGVIGLEPGAGWRSLAAERVAAAGHVIGGQGEYLPIASDSIDLVVSHQVLEHVGDPGAVIRETFRVLKPGGYCYVLYGNYLSFWEPHYRVHWLPLLPKAVGAMYLRLLGRSPRFLMDSITYTTFPAVRRAFLRAGFECMRERELRLALRSAEKTGWKWRVFRTIAWGSPQAALVLATAIDYLRRAFRTAASEWMRKPMASADPESPRF